MPSAGLNKVHYDAFISYRHSELDSFVAETLHKRLEGFKLPKSVHSKAESGKTCINRVFRDVDELPLADNLSVPIRQALDNSDYLICVCTPRYLESVWCMKEVNEFLLTHDRKHVLVVLAEDEPENSFPKILTYEDVEETDTDGNKVTIRHELEPLAADVRGANRKEILKAMDTAIIKLCAAIFGMTYDDLRQRHREQRLRRMAVFTGSIGAAVIAVAFFAVLALIKINEQNRLISSQYEELEDKYAGIMADTAEKMLAAGLRKDAVYALRDVLPDDAMGTYNPNALKGLYEAMGVYSTGSSRQPVCYYEMDTTIWSFQVSYDKRYLMAYDYNSIAIFDLYSGERLHTISTADEDQETYYMASFCGKDGLLIKDGRGLYYRSMVDGSEKEISDKNDYLRIFNKMDGEITLVYFNDDMTFIAVDGNGDIVFRFDLTPYIDGDYCSDIKVELKSDRFICAYVTGQSYHVLEVDLKNGSLLGEQTGADSDQYLTMSVTTAGDICYYAYTYMTDDMETVCEVYAADIARGIQIWNSEILNENMYDMFYVDGRLYLTGYDSVNILDAGSGEQTGRSITEEMPVTKWTADDKFYYMNQDYKIHCFSAAGESLADRDYFSYAPSRKLSYAIVEGDDMFCLPLWSNYLIRYSKESAKDAETITRDADPDRYDQIADRRVYDYEPAGDVLKSIPGFDSAHLDEAFYSTDGKFILAAFSNGIVSLYDAVTFECIKTYELEELSYLLLWYSENTGSYVIEGTGHTYILDENLDIVCMSGNIVCEDEGYFYIERYTDGYLDGFVRVPYVDMQELLRRTDEYLGGYVPHESIRTKYNIRNKTR